MNRIKQLFAWVKLQVMARYESAYQQWGQRSWIPASIQDARLDIDASTRKELVRRSRYWERNSGIMQRIADVFLQFTVGSNGLLMVPDSSNEDYNESATDYWADWCKSPDQCSFDNFGMNQQTMGRSLFFDGEIFTHKTFCEIKGRKTPCIEIIESHRCETPPAMADQEGKTIIDGIKIDKSGKPLGYYIKEGSDNPDYTFVPAAEMIHKFVKKRPGQYRGLPFLYPVMNDLHDLDDLQQYEMRAAKDASIISNVITTASGEVQSPATMRRAKSQILSQDANAKPVVKSDDQYYDVVFGTRSVMLKKGEDMKQFRSDRPSVTTREYWDYLTAKICAGVGVPRLLVFPFSLQGTVTRADLDVSAGLFRTRSEITEAVCREIYTWVMGWAIKFDRQLDGAPGDGTELDVSCIAPRSPNVDIGRNSAALLDELEAGGRTFKDLYGELGQDWRQQIRQKTKERAFIHRMAKEYSTPDSKLSVDEIAATNSPVDKPDPAEKNVSTSPAETATP